MEKIVVSEENANIRLDKFLSVYFKDLSRVYLQKLIQDNLVFVNDKIEKASYKVKLNDVILINGDEEVLDLDLISQDIPINVVYEDKDIIVINKEKGMIVHPAPGVYKDTLVNALLFHCKDLSSINGVKRPGIVHRIDKETSGLLVVAKNDISHIHLSNQLKDKTMNREYIALVSGVIKEDKGKINAPIGRDIKSRVKMAVTREGKEAITHFEVIKRYKNMTLIKCRLETGRTHQIRVHMAYIGYPLVSDKVYGNKPYYDDLGQYLHAYKLSLVHPRSNELKTFEIELPTYFKNTLDKLDKE